jgi:PAS domain S-box-containing protein
MMPEKILVVDDERRIVENIAQCLEREGFQVASAHAGDEAVAAFEQEGYDLVLLDISMPGMNGYEVMAHILGKDPDAMIIIMTGFASVESAVRALKLGAWDYLKKPFEYADLVKTMKNGARQRSLIMDKQAFAERLEASERQYEYMVNNSPDLIFTLDSTGCFSFVNRQFETVLGFATDKLIGRHFSEILHKDDRQRAGGLVAAVTQNAPFEINVRFKKAVRPDHSLDPYAASAFMELKASPITGAGDDSTGQGVYAVARDVTERLKLEAQLRQAQKMEAIGTLAGGIAHDFNNILMGIQGYASLVRSGFDRDSDVFKRLASIDEYVNNGAEMARQLLGFAQKNCQESYPLNLNYLLKMSAKMFGRTKKDILIEQDLEKRLWSTVVDEGQIKQVLMNLYVNAWQAMPGGGQIRVSSRNLRISDRQKDALGLSEAGTYVMVCVADTGMGMDKATMARIFDPFFTTKSRGQGSGLGLATAYGIVKSHKGTFKVESTIGEGTAFMFFLPASETRVDSCTQVENEHDAIVSGRGKILLVDDEKGVVEVCFDMLETLGYEVFSAQSGEEAVNFFQEHGSKIDLVILDMVMPEMSGMETFDALRKIKEDVKVLICSGYSREDEIRQMVDKGCDDYLLKPFDVAMLSEKLQSVFSKTRASTVKL